MDARSEAIQARFEWPVIIAAVMTIPLVLIQESNLAQPWPTIGTVLNWATWLVFATEVVVMLCIVPSKRTWLRSHILDVAVTVLTPPFAPAAWQAGRVYRVLRLMRLLRVFSLRRLLSLDGLKMAAADRGHDRDARRHRRRQHRDHGAANRGPPGTGSGGR